MARARRFAEGTTIAAATLRRVITLPRISVADCVTLGNGLCGLLATTTALGLLGHRHDGSGLTRGQLAVCSGLILFGTALDVLDGAAAKRFGSSGMGSTLDTLSDVLTFGLAPAVMLTAASSGDPEPWRTAILIGSCAFVLASMLRLARFTAYPAPPGGGFYGLAMPSAAGAIIALAFARPGSALTLAGVLVVSALMVSGIRYPHADARTIPLLSVYGVFIAVALIGLIPTRPVALAWLAVVGLTPAMASRQARRARERELLHAAAAPRA